MNARLYDPAIGAFLSPDNEISFPENPQNYNRFSYALNNPLKYTDPSGNNPFGIIAMQFLLASTVDAWAKGGATAGIKTFTMGMFTMGISNISNLLSFQITIVLNVTSIKLSNEVTMNFKIKTILFIPIFLLLSFKQIGFMMQNDKKIKDSNIMVYDRDEKLTNSENRTYYINTCLVLDKNRNQYQIMEITSLTKGGDGQIGNVSQGYIEIQKNRVKLIDKNNSLISICSFSNEKIQILSGIRFYHNKSFNRVRELSGIWYGIVEFLDWDDKYLLFDKQNKKINSIKKSLYCEHIDERSSYGIHLNISDTNYVLYYQEGNMLKFGISIGSWKVQDGLLELKDNDRINKFYFYVIDDKTITPTKRLPFSYEISRLKYVEPKKKKE